MKNLLPLLLAVLLPILGFSQSCELENLRIESLDCDQNDSIEITINLDFMNTSDSFTLSRTGRVYGTFAYSDLPVLIGKEDADCMTKLELRAEDINDMDCFTTNEIGPLCCDCRIVGLNAQATGCNDDTCMEVVVDFRFLGVGTQGFNVFDDQGNLIGNYAYSTVPVTIDCWPVTGQASAKITVCDDEEPTCCASSQFITLDCDSCDIFNLIAQPLQCDTLKRFSILTDFEYDMIGDSGYCVMVNDSLFGPFSYDTTERIIGPFQGGCDSSFTVVAFDKELANCADSVTVDKPCCDPCVIGGIMGQVLECNGDSCLKVVIDFDYIGTGANGFELYTRNGLFGTYSYGQLPLTIDCFPITDPDTEFVRVCDVDSIGCCNEAEFPTIDCSLPCEITNLVAVDTDCDGRGQFLVTLDFDHVNSSDSFYVFGNNRSLGPFAYNRLPLTIGPFQGDCRTNYEFVVTDSEDPLCKDEALVGVKCCDPCELTNLEVETLRCNGDSCMVIEIDFDHNNTGNTGFDIFIASGYFGTFSYLQLPLTIDCFPLTGSQFESIKICDGDFIDCCVQTEFLALDCSLDTCSISDLNVTAKNCTGQDSFMAEINFAYRDTCDDEFILSSNGQLSTHRYSALPVTVGPFFGGCGSTSTFVVYDSACITCTDTAVVVAPCCDTTCNIFDLDMVQTMCDTNDQFFLDIDFMYENTSDSFYVRGNGRNEGPIAYDDLPYRLGPLDGDCIMEYVVAIVDAEDDDCREIEVIGKVCCGDTCEISNLDVEVLRCNGDSCLVIEIDFDTSDTGGSQFEVFDKNGLFGIYDYSQLPLIIDCYTISGDTFEFIKVCDLGNADCCAALEFPAVDCDQLCAIYDVELEQNDCDTNEMFTVDLQFAYDNVSDSFRVSRSGSMEGPFAYDELPVVLGPYEGDCMTSYDFVISDQEDPSCSGSGSIGVVCCGDTCLISDLTVEESPCDTNGMFTAILDFNHMTNTDSFLLTGNGRMEGPFAYGNLPMLIGPYAGDCTTSYEFIVTDLEDTTCTAIFNLGTICCQDTCEISNLVVSASPCDTNDMFLANLNFTHSGTTDSFLVNTNTGTDGPFAYDDLPVQVGPFEGDCMTDYNFEVYDSGDTTCRADDNLGVICCKDTCMITGLRMNTSDCDTNDMFFVFVDFDAQENSDSFYIIQDTVQMGPYSYDNVPLIIGPFDGDCVTDYEFTVADVEDFNCRATFDLGRVCCKDTCKLEDLSARAIRCNGDSCLVVTLDFDFSNAGSTFDVFDRDGIVGTYDYSMLPFLTIDCYPISGEDMEYMRVCDSEDTSCCVETEFDPLDCTTAVTDLEDEGWSIRYNPHASVLVVKKTQSRAQSGSLYLTDLLGHRLGQFEIDENREVNVSRFQSGVYFARFETNGKSYILKFTKL